MTITKPSYSARILGPPDVPVPIRASGGEIVLDSGRAPHVQASIEVGLTDAGLLDELDPRDGRRMVIEAGGRIFDLGIRAANPDRVSATVEVQLASDEAILADFAQLVDDPGPRMHEASLRNVCNYVLGKIGATLEPGPDADVTAYWSETNLIKNSCAALNVDGWDGAGLSTVTRVTGLSGPARSTGVRGTHLSSSSGYWDFRSEFIPVRVGQRYTIRADVRASVSRELELLLTWFDGETFISEVSETVTTLEWATLITTGIAPPRASRARLIVRATTAGSAGQWIEGTCFKFTEGNNADPRYWAGDSSDANYTYEFAGDAHASASRRTPVVERHPDSLRWLAGVSALEFLHPIVQAAGFRLVCNERREWTLRDASYREPGSQTYRAGINIVAAEEELTRDGDEWFDAAVYRYTWTDADKVEQIRVDAHALNGTPSKVVHREIEAAYPGPGRAQYAVTRAQGRGRIVTATKQADWTEAAEQTFSAVLDGTPIQIGTVERVEFDLARNEVISTSRTTDTPPEAWVILPENETWLDSPIGESWMEEVI